MSGLCRCETSGTLTGTSNDGVAMCSKRARIDDGINASRLYNVTIHAPKGTDAAERKDDQGCSNVRVPAKMHVDKEPASLT